MKNKDTLSELIHSLSKNEKRHFSLFTSRNGEKSNYVQLFEAIDKQKEYNEKQLLEFFSKTLISKNFKVIKHYLARLILKSLRSFYSNNNSVNTIMTERLHDIEILFEKGLYALCQKNIIQARYIAEKYEHHLFMLELMQWQQKLFTSKSYQGLTEQDLDKFYSNVFDSINKYKNVMEREYQVKKIFFKIQKGPIRTSIDFPPPAIEHKQASMSFLEEFYTYIYYGYYYYAKNEHDNSFHYLQRARVLLEKHPHHLAERQYEYVDLLYNNIISLFKFEKYDEIISTIKKLKAVSPTSLRIKQYIFYLVNDLEASLYNKLGLFSKGIGSIEVLIDMLAQPYMNFLNQQDKIILYYKAACIYMGAEDYTKANKYINQLLNDNDTDIRSDCYCFSKILQLIIYYEKEDFDLLEYRIKSVKNFLVKKERLYKVETIILDFFKKKLLHIHTHRQLIEAFKVLKEQMMDVTKDPFEKKALDYFDFISWLESKIEGKTFAEVVRGKIKAERIKL